MKPPDSSLSSAELAAHASYLRGLARALLGERPEADDLVQDTLVAALEHPPRGVAGLKAWLATVARNRAIGQRRGESRRTAREADVARPEAGPDASEALERLELAQRLASEVARLREPYRTAIYLRYHEGLAPAQIAERLGEPVKTVKTRLARALELLRERLDARDGGREAWSALLAPLAFPRSASAAAAPLAATLTGALAVKKLALAAAVLIALALAVQGVRVLDRRMELASDGTAGASARISPPRPAPGPDAVPVASEPRTALEPTEEAGTPSTGHLLLTMVWADDGSPASEVCAEVQVLDGHAPRPDRLHARSDGQGSARFEDLPAGRLRFFPPIGSSSFLTITAGSTLEERVELHPGSVVEGRVVAPDGAPVGDAEVRAMSFDGQALLSHAVARSRPDGTFRARGVDPESWVGAAARGWLPSLAFQPGDLPVGPRGTREVELRLGEPGGRIAGRVVDDEGTPVAGAQVLAGPRGGANTNLPTGQVGVTAGPALLLTGADGSFEYSGDVEPGLHLVEVIAAGHPVWFGNVEVQDGARAWLEVRLERPARVVGRVLDAQGAPKPGVQVRASREVGAYGYMDRTPVPTALTDERGEFALDWVHPGEVELRASVPDDDCAGRARARLTCEPGGLREVELALDPEPAIRGRVVDGEGRPLEGWRVHTRSAEWLDMSPLHPGTMSVLMGVRSTDAEGRFVVPNADDLAWDIAVAAPEEFPIPPRAERKGVRAGDGEIELVVANSALEPCTLVVRLVDADGRPPQDVQATLWDEHRTAGVYPEYDASTGVATWSVSLPGRYAVQVRRGSREIHAGELVDLRPGEPADLGEIHLDEPGEVVVDARVPDGFELERLRVKIVAAHGVEELELELDGEHFRAESIAPGRYVLRAGHKALFAPEREFEVRPGEVARIEIELVPAFPVGVTFEFPAASQAWHSVDWEVRDPAGVALCTGRVRQWKGFAGSAAPGIHGLGLPQGRLTLRATSDTGLSAELVLDISDPRTARGPHVLEFRP